MFAHLKELISSVINLINGERTETASVFIGEASLKAWSRLRFKMGILMKKNV